MSSTGLRVTDSSARVSVAQEPRRSTCSAEESHKSAHREGWMYKLCFHADWPPVAHRRPRSSASCQHPPASVSFQNTAMLDEWLATRHALGHLLVQQEAWAMADQVRYSCCLCPGSRTVSGSPSSSSSPSRWPGLATWEGLPGEEGKETGGRQVVFSLVRNRC